MSKALNSILHRIDAMTLRERALVFLALVFVFYLLWSSLLMDPLEKQQRAMLQRMSAMQGEIRTLELQIQAVVERGKRDPNNAARRELAGYRAELEQLDAHIGSTVGSLIKPQQMARILEEALTRDTRLSLLKVESLGSTPLIAVEPEPPVAEDEPAVGIYRHGLRLEFEGDYLSALDYLKAVQALPWALYWDGFRIVSIDYPRAHISIEVHTLSLQEGWIGV